MTEAPADDSEPVAPAPTLPSRAMLKRTAKVVPTQGTAGKGTPPSSKKQQKGKDKESDNPGESDDDDAGEESEEEDPAQVLETQQKRKRAPASHLDASPDDSGKDQPKRKAKTAPTASADFKPPSGSGAQSSPGTVASPIGTSTVARSLRSSLRVQDRRRSKPRFTHVFLSLFAGMCARGLAHWPLTRMQIYALRGLYIFAELLFQCLYIVHSQSCFCCLLYTIVAATLSARGLAH